MKRHNPRQLPYRAKRRRRDAAAARMAVAIAALVGPAGAALAATKTWTNGGTFHDSQWDTTANWSPTGEPTSSSDVDFPSLVPFSSFFISLTSGENARSLTLHNFYHLQSGSLALATGSVVTDSG